MKKNAINLLKIITTVWVVAIIAACNTNNFSEPQPANSTNLFEFPAMFHGKWADKDYNVVETDGKHITFVDILDIRVPLDSTVYVQDKVINKTTGAVSKHISTISYDTAGKPSDTTLEYVIREPFIYKVGSDNLLQTGYRFKQSKDTLVIFKNERQGIDLGNNAFLRKVTDSLYALNLSNRILIRDNYFWQVLLVQKTARDEINFYVPSDRMNSLSCMFYQYGDNLFYDCKWSGEEILRLIKDGYFEKTSTLTRMN
jgi:hypothetical protein